MEQQPNYGWQQTPPQTPPQYRWDPQRGWQPVGNAPQGGRAFMPPEKQRDHRQIRRISNATGLAVVAFSVLPVVVSLLLYCIPGFSEAYNTNQGFYMGINALFSAEIIALPFLVSYAYQRREKLTDTLAFGTPASAGAAFLLVLVGLLLCMVGNYATNFLSNFVSVVFGITFTSPTDHVTLYTAGDFAIRMLEAAVIPALVEEFAVRGTVLMPLRRYGDKFALVMSALVFALMHGNMVQIPFAFIAGLGIGYAVLATGTVWTGVVIHFLNNFIAVCSEAAYDMLPASTAAVLTLAMIVTAIVAGLVALIVFLVRYRRPALDAVKTPLDSRERNRAFLCSAPMIIAIVLLVLKTIEYVEF